MTRVLFSCATTLLAVVAFVSFESDSLSAQDVRKIPVNRDTWLSSVQQERLGSNGGAARLKLKSYQEMSIVDFDASSLKGRVIEKAYLHLNVVDKKRLLRLTTSSISAEWFEGNATGYGQEEGASTFQFRQLPDVPWSYPNSDFTSVILGSGNSWWGSFEPTDVDEKGWQKVEVSPQVIAARIAGLSHGFLIFDDVGSEWKRTGDKFEVFPFPNRYIYSRQQNASVAPYFTIQVGAEDRQAPLVPTNLVSESTDLPAGEALIHWKTPTDEGPAGPLGFEVKIDNNRVPLYLVPKGDITGATVQMHVRDLGLDPEQKHVVSVAAIDRAGNIGQAATLTFVVSELGSGRKNSTSKANEDSLPEFLVPKPRPWDRMGAVEFSIIDELDKLNLKDGKLLSNRDESYWTSNHLWHSFHYPPLWLAGAKKEWIGFQVVLKGNVKESLTASFTLDGGKQEIPLHVGRYAPIVQGDTLIGDPIIPVSRWKTGSSYDNQDAKFSCFHVEMHIPPTLAAGKYEATLKLGLGQETRLIGTEFQVFDIEIPDKLSFLPEMNAYGLPNNELDYYRLAHRHRTVLNRLPYYHNGRVSEGCAPEWNGSKMEWTKWDQRFAPLLTGEAFADLERGGVPIECFYLPLFENWPIPIEPNYKESYWADEALSDSYRQQFETASKEIASHIKEKKWDKTLFHFYLNGKNNFKERGWSRSTSPWILDEPAHYQDFDALRWFGEAFRNGTAGVGVRNVVFRTDVSRPEWQREILDGLVGYAVVSSAVRQYPRLVLDRAKRNGEKVIEYGTTNRLDQSNVQPEAWCVDAWALGLDGVLPWQTIGTAESWKTGDELALFYPDPESNSAPPIPSIRLKAYRRGQQDTEYLQLLCKVLDAPRWGMAGWVRDNLNSNAVREGTGIEHAEDAGRVNYSNLQPGVFAMIRRVVAESVREEKGL